MAFGRETHRWHLLRLTPHQRNSWARQAFVEWWLQQASGSRECRSMRGCKLDVCQLGRGLKALTIHSLLKHVKSTPSEIGWSAKSSLSQNPSKTQAFARSNSKRPWSSSSSSSTPFRCKASEQPSKICKRCGRDLSEASKTPVRLLRKTCQKKVPNAWT